MRFIENVTNVLKEVAEMQGLELSIRHESLPGSVRGTREIMESTFKFVKDDFTIVSSTHVTWRKVTGDTFDVVRCILMDLKQGLKDETVYPKTPPRFYSSPEWKAAINSVYGRYSTLTQQYLPSIKNVIFNDPATIIMWADGTKTVVKAVDEDYDPEKGMAMAISKKALGNKGNYYDVFTKELSKVYATNEEIQKIIDNIRKKVENDEDKLQQG